MLRVLKALVESVDLGIYSYVKPAAPHRFSTKYLDLHTYVRSFTDALESYFRAIEAGFSVAEGRLGLNSVSLGSLISNAISSTTKSLHLRGAHNLHLILVPVVVAASYAYRLEGSRGSSNFINRLNEGLKDLLLYTGTNDVLAIYDALRSHEGLLKEVINRVALTRGRIESEGMNLYDFYSELGREDSTLRFFVRKHTSIASYAQRYVDVYLETGDYNRAAIEVFSLIAQDISGIKIPVISGRDDLLKLLRMDREMSRKGTELSDLIPLHISSLFIANLLI